MTITLTRPTKKLTLVSVRHVYRCKEYPRWHIEKAHITVGEDCCDPCPDCWQVFKAFPYSSCLVSQHRTKAAAVKAMAKAIREELKQ